MTDSSISTVYAWGCLNGRGAAQTYPLQMHGLSGENAMSCAAGTDHSLVLLSCGAVWVCGQADDCRSDVLRQGTSDSGMTFPMQQAKFDGARISSVAAGDSTSYAISHCGKVYSWGQGRYAVLGHNDGEQNHIMPARIRGFPEDSIVRRITCGRWHCAALVDRHQVFLWGRNHCGQLGLGFLSRACVTPVKILLEPDEDCLLSVRDLAAGEAHTVVIADAGHAGLDARAYSWGDPNDSRLGGVDVRLHHSPQLVKTINHTLERLRLNIAKEAQQPKNSIVSCGIAHTLVLTTTGQFLAWGCGKYGQLGYGDLWDREEPVVVPGVHSVLTFATGNRHNIAVQRVAEAHAALAKRETVYAWGSNAFGELGLGDTNVRLQPATLCTLNESIKGCAAGARHSLVLARASR